MSPLQAVPTVSHFSYIVIISLCWGKAHHGQDRSKETIFSGKKLKIDQYPNMQEEVMSPLQAVPTVSHFSYIVILSLYWGKADGQDC